MDIEELEYDPTSRFLTTPTTTTTVEAEPGVGGNAVFWMVGDDGQPQRMTWTEDGRIVAVDVFGWEGD